MKADRGLLTVKRVYDPPAASDGTRLLVERLWPRGIKKEALKLDAWLRDVAPSAALRTWFSHDPAKWTEFQRRYREELDANPDHWKEILRYAEKGPVTLLFSSRDTEHNKPVAVSVVTLLVNPSEAERLTLASSEGKIQLALRNPLDESAPVTPGVRPAGLFGAPPRTTQARVAAARRNPAAPVETAQVIVPPLVTVEMIRGDKRVEEVVR